MESDTGIGRLEAGPQDWEGMFSLLAENSLSGVFVLEGRAFTCVNPRFCQFVGRTREELAGLRNALDIIDKEQRTEVEKTIQELLEGGASGRSMAIHVTRGNAGPVELNATLIAVPGVAKPTVLGSVEDAGETRRLKESLRNAEERFRFAARASQELIWECNLANSRIWCNEGIMTVFKHTPETAPRTMEQLIDCVHPADRDSVEAGLKLLAAAAKPLWLSEFRFRRGDGVYSHVLARAFVLLGSDRAPLRVIGSLFDNTQHRALETQLMESQRLSSLGALANGLAHDVNNLLTPILTAAQRLKEDAFIDESQTSLIETIETNCQRGATLARELMRFGDGQSGGVRAMRINKLIESVAHVFRETFPKNIYLQHDAPESLHKVRADELQIDQVLMNLCIHARDHMPDGGELSCTAENVTLDRQFALASGRVQPGPHVKLRVKDTGRGFTPDELKRLFDPSQEHRSDRYLGLVTVDSIVEKLGGDIVVQSNPGKWTQFDVYLPAVIEEEEGEEQLEDAPQRPGHGELIMLVDDEPKILELTSEMLEHHGYKVMSAPDGAAAVTLYCQRKHEIAVVLMDLKMPVMDGVTAIRVLRGINPHLKIVATTGSVLGLDEVSAPKHRLDGFLRKPYTNARLLKVVNEVISRR